MNRDGLKQRISYLIEHGGTYPEERPDWKGWAILALLAISVVLEALQLLH